MKTLKDIDVKGKKVVLRLDLNVPLRDGKILDTTRIEKSIPTIKKLLENKATIFILSHLGRPNGEVVEKLSLEPIANEIENQLGQKVYFAGKESIGSIQPGEVALLENIRFHPGEENNEEELAQLYASLGDVFINDAFSVSHRSHASVDAIAKLLPSAAGPLFEQEISALLKLVNSSKKPVMAIIGGAKISTKITLLESLIDKVDVLVPVGGIANTFLKEKGYDIRESLVEDDYLKTAKNVILKSQSSECNLILPTDVVVAKKLEQNIKSLNCSIDKIPEDFKIFDMGEESTKNICEKIQSCKTVLWNGPLGVTEVKPFDKASVQIAKCISNNSEIYSVAGGGETVMTLRKCGLEDSFSYLSTAGGAFLEFIEGKKLPGLEALK